MKHVVVYHTQGDPTHFDGENTIYQIMNDGSLLVQGWETTTEVGTATFAAGQWAQVRGSTDKEAQATRLVVTVGEPIPKPLPPH